MVTVVRGDGNENGIDATDGVDIEALIVQITSEEEEERRAQEFARRPLQEPWQRRIAAKMNAVCSPISYPYPSIVSEIKCMRRY